MRMLLYPAEDINLPLFYNLDLLLTIKNHAENLLKQIISIYEVEVAY